MNISPRRFLSKKEQIVEFNTSNPNTAGTVFTPATPQNADVLYSTVVGGAVTFWKWNPASGTYLSAPAPAAPTLLNLVSRKTNATGDAGVTDFNMSAVGVDTGGTLRLSNALSIPDLRNTSPMPQDYAANSSWAFKTLIAAGIAQQNDTLGTYIGVNTIRRYGSAGDFSGGAVWQDFFSDQGKKFGRVSASPTTWTQHREYVMKGGLGRANIGTLLAGNVVPNGYSSYQDENGSWVANFTLPANAKLGDTFTFIHFAGFDTIINVANTGMAAPLTVTTAMGGATFVYALTKWILTSAKNANEWYLGGGTVDSPGDKNSAIYRNGRVGVGGVNVPIASIHATSVASNVFFYNVNAPLNVSDTTHKICLGTLTTPTTNVILPTASSQNGREIKLYIANDAADGTGGALVTSLGGQVLTKGFNSTANVVLSSNYIRRITLTSDGTNWHASNVNYADGPNKISSRHPFANAAATTVQRFGELNFRYNTNAVNADFQISSATGAAVAFRSVGRERFSGAAFNNFAANGNANANPTTWTTVPAGGLNVNEQLWIAIVTPTNAYRLYAHAFDGVSFQMTIEKDV